MWINSIMESTKYKCSIECTHCNKANLKDVLGTVKPTYLKKIMCQDFFKCFCQTISGTKKRLNMQGTLVRKKISRNLQDADIPAMSDFLKKYREIKHLNLAGNDITDYGFIVLLDHILETKNIVELDIHNNNIVGHGLTYLWQVRKVLELKNLNLKANKLDPKASKCIGLFLLENKCMEDLNVADVSQTASSLIYFIMALSSSQTVFNKTLKKLDISRPNPGFKYFFDSTHFADVIGLMLKQNTTLAALHLQRYSFSCHDIECMISNAIYNNSLHLLDLGCNNIGDHGIDHIAKWLMKRPVLKVLILCKNIITSHGARTLSLAFPFSRLLSLDVSYNNIQDDGMTSILHTLKKTPMLRHLKIFGNTIGHPTAKIIKRMLISKVLNQENIDVRPYMIDCTWCFARYDGEHCRKEYEDVPYGLFMQERTPAPSRPNESHCRFTYSESTQLAYKHSIMTIISKTMSKEHQKECRCCYCLKCQGPYYNKECRKADHPDSCTCCTCTGNESSDWSVDESVLKRLVSSRDTAEGIDYILKRVNSDTKNMILRWINMDKQVLEKDLKFIGDPSASQGKLNDATVSCTCSWEEVDAPTLQTYLEERCSKELIILPKNINTCIIDSSKESVSSN